MDVVKFLLPDLDSTEYGTDYLGNAFKYAILNGDATEAVRLFKQICDINLEDKKNVGLLIDTDEGMRPALLLAVSTHNYGMVRTLLKDALDYDIVEGSHSDLMIYASCVGNNAVKRHLLQ